MGIKDRVDPEVYENIMDCYGWRCYLCNAPAEEMHHRLAKHKWRKDKYPLFINSVFNLKPLCKKCHNSGKIYDIKITDREAELYEAYLKYIAKRCRKKEIKRKGKNA